MMPNEQKSAFEASLKREVNESGNTIYETIQIVNNNASVRHIED